jgi:hypothetical protein
MVDACLQPDPDHRPGLEELRRELRAAVGNLDADAALPAPEGSDAMWEPRVRGFWLAAFATALATACVLLARGGRPGGALVLAVVASPVLWLLRRAPRHLLLPPLAPILGTAGLSAAFPAIAGLTRPWVRRASTAALGYLWLAVAAAGLGVEGPLGPGARAPDDWSASMSGGTELLAGLAEPALVAGAAVWVAAALAFAVLVRGRLLVLDVLGAIVWSACVVSAHRLLGEEAAGPAPPGWILALTVLAVASFAALRRGAPAIVGPARAPVHDH